MPTLSLSLSHPLFFNPWPNGKVGPRSPAGSRSTPSSLAPTAQASRKRKTGAVHSNAPHFQHPPPAPVAHDKRGAERVQFSTEGRELRVVQRPSGGEGTQATLPNKTDHNTTKPGQQQTTPECCANTLPTKTTRRSYGGTLCVSTCKPANPRRKCDSHAVGIYV